MSDEEILAEVGKYPAVTVILTGGEPSLWIDREFVDCLHRMGKYVCIETNGTHSLPDNIDWVTCSPKQGAKLCISRMDEVKVVYEGQDIAVYESLPCRTLFPATLFLQQYCGNCGLRDAASEMAAELADAQADRNKIRPCNF